MTEPTPSRPPFAWKRALMWVLLFGAAYLGLDAMRRAGTVPAGNVAPSMVTSLDSGAVFDLSAQRGKVVVLNFWATYCGPCRAEAPVLSRVSQSLEASGGVLVGVSVESLPLTEVTRVARELGMTYPIGLAPNDALNAYKVQVVPTTYVIAPDGVIVKAIVGAVNDDELSEAIDEAKARRS